MNKYFPCRLTTITSKGVWVEHSLDTLVHEDGTVRVDFKRLQKDNPDVVRVIFDVALDPVTVHRCVVCRAVLHPERTALITAHEFKCFKARPDLVPPNCQGEFERLLRWERRSEAAKRGAAKRKLLRS